MFGKQALRVLLLAYKDVPSDCDLDNEDELVSGLTLQCIVGAFPCASHKHVSVPQAHTSLGLTHTSVPVTQHPQLCASHLSLCLTLGVSPSSACFSLICVPLTHAL